MLENSHNYRIAGGSSVVKNERSRRVEKSSDGKYIIKREIIYEERVDPALLEHRIKAFEIEINNYKTLIAEREKQIEEIKQMIKEAEG